MKTSATKGFGIVRKIYRDLRRGNDPSIGWGATQQYLAVLVWTRTILVFGVALGGFLGLALIYAQLQQAPSQKFLRECQQREPNGDCTTQWNKLTSNS